MAAAIYQMAREDEWAAAQADGAYPGGALDRSDGVIHVSNATQIGESAAKHRAGQTGLVLLAVVPDALGEALRWEESRGGALFPHLYGTLPVAAVLWTMPLPLGADGRHVFPPL
jgi:uncharacterized protein (DUF952 family)